MDDVYRFDSGRGHDMKFPFQVWLDTELKVIHSSPACAGAKIPSKYGYLHTEYIRNIEQARELDAIYRACEACRIRLSEQRRESGKTHRFTKRKREGE